MKLIKKIKHYINKNTMRLVLNNGKRTFPNFMIIGAPKSGTTSLFHYLSQHPQIIPPKTKEPAFFSWNRHHTLHWYSKQFPKRKIKGNKLTFEATPSYLSEENAPQQISNLFPTCKFIVILRNPVSRAYSHWSFYHNSNFIEENIELRDKRSFKEAINDELNATKKIPFYWKYVELGMYSKQLNNWLNFFPKENFLIINFSELKHEPKKVLDKCTTFLNISGYYHHFEKTNITINNLKHESGNENNKFKIHNHNPSKKEIDTVIYKKLVSFYEPYNRDLYNLTGIDFNSITKTL